MRALRRYLILLAAASVFIALFAVPAVAGPAGQFISKINSSRSAAGLPPVQGYWDLSDNARSHSNSMAERGELYHSGNLGSVTSGWSGLGENVGVGLDVAGLHQAFMDSSGHRRNILGDFNYVGVGVTVDGAGFMWVTVIFMRGPDGLNDPAPTTTTVPPTTTTTTMTPHLPPMITTTTTQPPTPAPTTTTTTTRPPAQAPTTTTTTQPSASASTTTTQPPAGPSEVDLGGIPPEFYEIWGEHFLYGRPAVTLCAI